MPTRGPQVGEGQVPMPTTEGDEGDQAIYVKKATG